MSNPIIGRPDAFTRHGGAQQQAYAQGAPQYGTDPYQTQYQQPPVATGGGMTPHNVLAHTAVPPRVVAPAAPPTLPPLPPPVWPRTSSSTSGSRPSSARWCSSAPHRWRWCSS